MGKKVLIISDKDLNSGLLTGIELRSLQMKDYFKSIGAKVAVWCPSKKTSTGLFRFFRRSLPSDLEKAINQTDFVYAAVTSSTQSTIYKLSQHKAHPKIILDLFTPLLVEKRITGAAMDQKETIVGEQIAAADHFICATPRQLAYSKKIVTRFIPDNHVDISVVPFIPPSVSGEVIKNDRKNILDLSRNKRKIFWVGAFYPWFDQSKLIDLILQTDDENNIFVVIGGKNPKTHAYDKNYEKIYHWAVNEELLGKKILFVDWLPYGQFDSFLRQGDLAILFVNDSEEDRLSIRSRLLSCYMAGLPVITNGRDELTKLAKSLKLSYEYSEKNSKNNISRLIKKSIANKKADRWSLMRIAIEKWTKDKGLKKLIND